MRDEGSARAEGSVRLERTELGETLVLDNPARRNALTLPMWQDLGRLARERGSATAAPLYVRGAGGYFCSGADLDTLTWARREEGRAVEFVHAVVECLLSLHAVEREVVAVVEGGAAGGGVEIMAACDRRVAVGSPTLVFPFGQHGMALDAFTRWRLHQLVGEAVAERLLHGRQVVAGDEAQGLGLLDERVDSPASLATHERERHAIPLPARERYLTGTDDLPDAVPLAARPMLRAFPPHR